jgi:3-hydroxyisobutyrate dehydrogenase
MISAKTYEPVPALRIAYIGLGTMGAPMAAHLIRAGHQVTVYNRTRSKADAFVAEHGGVVANAPADAVCVGQGGAFQAMAPSAILVDHTTTSAQVAQELSQQASLKKLHFIDAPVSGGNLGAINGVLTVMCGGDQAAFARIQPVLMAYSRAVTHLGASGSGQLAKMVNQISVAGLLQGLAEALAFGQKAGLDMHQVLQVITQGAATSWQMQNRGPTMVNDQFDFGFAVDWMRKDLGLCLDEARRQGASLPATALIDQFYADIQAQGGGRWDTSSLIRRLR